MTGRENRQALTNKLKDDAAELMDCQTRRPTERHTSSIIVLGTGNVCKLRRPTERRRRQAIAHDRPPLCHCQLEDTPSAPVRHLRPAGGGPGGPRYIGKEKHHIVSVLCVRMAPMERETSDCLSPAGQTGPMGKRDIRERPLGPQFGQLCSLQRLIATNKIMMTFKQKCLIDFQ